MTVSADGLDYELYYKKSTFGPWIWGAAFEKEETALKVLDIARNAGLADVKVVKIVRLYEMPPDPRGTPNG